MLFFSCFLPINSLLNFPRFRIYEFPLLISIRMINCPAATPRKKDLFDRNMCTRMGKFNEKSEKDFFRAMAVYIYIWWILFLFFFFPFSFSEEGWCGFGRGNKPCEMHTARLIEFHVFRTEAQCIETFRFVRRRVDRTVWHAEFFDSNLF